IALDPFEHDGEAGARVDGISAAYGRVVELPHQLVAGTAREGRNGFPLPAVAVLVGSNVGRRASPQVSNRRNFCLGCHGLIPLYSMVILRIPYNKVGIAVKELWSKN